MIFCVNTVPILKQSIQLFTIQKIFQTNIIKIMMYFTGFILTLNFDIFACLASFLILVVVIYHFCYKPIKPDDKLTIIHSIHIYLYCF